MAYLRMILMYTYFIIKQIKVPEHQSKNIRNHHLFDRLVDEIGIFDIIKLSFDKNITHYNFYVHKTHADPGRGIT